MRVIWGSFIFVIMISASGGATAWAETPQVVIPDPDAWVTSPRKDALACCSNPVCNDVDEKKLLSVRDLPIEALGALVRRDFEFEVLSRKPGFEFPIRFNLRSDFKTVRLFSAATVIDWEKAPAGVADRIRLHGAARAPGFGDDGVLSVMCHEVGHILGGGPFLKNRPLTVLEAQADDFAARKCLPKIFRADPETPRIAASAAPEVSAICGEKYSDALELAVCKRVLMAGEQTMKQYHWGACLNPSPGVRKQRAAGFRNEQRDLSYAKTLHDDYPSLQCRLETYIAAALGEERASCWYPRAYNASAL